MGSRWQDSFDNHPVHATLENQRNRLEKIRVTASESILVEVEHFLNLTQKLRDVLSDLDPEFITLDRLNNLNSTLQHQQVVQGMALLESNRTGINVMRQLDILLVGQLAALANLLPLSREEEEPNSHYKRRIDKYITDTTQKVESLAQEAQSFKGQVEQQSAKTAELEKIIDQRREETANQLSVWQKQFSEEQNERIKEHIKKLQDIKKEADGVIFGIEDKATQELDEQQADFEESIASILENARSKNTEIESLYGLIGQNGVAGDYQVKEEKEKKTAFRWQMGAIASLAAAAVWLICVIIFDFTLERIGDMSSQYIVLWPKIIPAMSLTFLLLTGAGYAALQSTKHREEARRLQWFALEVKAFDPFIHSLTEEQQRELKQDLTRRIFGQSSREQVQEKALNNDQLLDQLGALISKLSKEHPFVKAVSSHIKS